MSRPRFALYPRAAAACTAALAVVAAPGVAVRAEPVAPLKSHLVDARDFHVLERESGPVNYYRTDSDDTGLFIRGVYRPGLSTTTLFYPMPEDLRHGVRRLRWRWRAVVLPREGNECVGGRADSAVNFYVTWKRGLKWYSLKFVWTSEGKPGETCAGKRNPFVAQDSIVIHTGGPTNVWREEEIDPDALFRKHFEEGDPKAEVPDLAGLGLLVDGDQTQSVSSGDLGSVELLH